MKPKIILIVAFVLAFAAGGSVALLAVRPPPPPPPRGVLMAELNLTPEQREQMGRIWTETTGALFRQHGERRAALAQERDQQIRALLDEGQLARYETILQDYSRGVEELSQERKRNFDEARERTKKILTPEQASRYDELIKKQRERGPGGPGGPGGSGGPGGPRGFHGSRRGHTAPASRSTSMESAIPLVGE